MMLRRYEEPVDEFAAQEVVMLMESLARGDCFSLPGVYDPYSARIAEHYVKGPLYMTGYGVSATLLGKPDAGLVSYSQMVERVRQIATVVQAPLVADGDTGFGGLANVAQAVVGYEQAGAVAIQIEDQVFPKRCGHIRDRQVIPAEEMVKKIKVVCDTRDSADFVMIARTDARTQLGLDEALRRGERYAEAGADALFIESPESPSELAAIAEAFKGIPLVANMVAGGRTPMLPDQELFDLGFQLVLHPTYLLGAITLALETSLQTLMTGGQEQEGIAQFDRLNHWVDFASILSLDEEQ